MQAKDPRNLSWVALVTTVVLLGAWEVASLAGTLSPLLFPPPSTWLRSAWRMAADGRLVEHTVETVRRVVLAVAVGGAAGFLSGLATGRNLRLRSAIDPLIALTHPVPKVALLPIFLLIFGLGEMPIIVLVSLSAFFPMAITTMAGVGEIHDAHFEVAASYHAPRVMVLRRVVLPAALPVALAGLRLTVNMALVVTIAVELIYAATGLGVLIWFAWETLRVAEMYATLCVIAALGILSNAGLQWLERRATPWRSVRRS